MSLFYGDNNILYFQMDPGVWCRGMKANPKGYLWSKYEAIW